VGIRWLVDAFKNASYKDQPDEVNFNKEIQFVKEHAPFILAGAKEAIIYQLQWGKKICKVIAFGIGCINVKSEPVIREEKPKELPPTQIPSI